MKIRKSQTGRYLTEEEIEYVKENSKTITMKQMAEAIGKSHSTVSTLCKTLNLVTTKSFFQPDNIVVPPFISNKK